MMNFRKRFVGCIQKSVPSGVKTSIWLIKITLPVSFAVLLLEYYGILEIIATFSTPLFQLIGLSGVAALVLITSIFTNIYSVVAVMTTLALPEREGTILAVMCLISHGFVIETAILKKTGSSAVRMLLLRLIASFVVGAVLNWILPGSGVANPVYHPSHITTLMQTIVVWLPQIGLTLLKIFILVNVLLVLQQCLEEFGLLKLLTRPLAPIMVVMGLPKKASFLWIIGNTIGLAYGSAVMLKKAEEGELSTEECDLLNHHLAVSHSQIEDPLLFVSLGYALPVLIVPRFLFAIIVVWLRRLENKVKKSLVHKK